MSFKKCSVSGCFSENVRVFRFPVYREKTRDKVLRWISATGNEKLLTLPPRLLCFRSICEKHFESRYVLSHKLSLTAVPTLHLPEPIDATEYSQQWEPQPGLDTPYVVLEVQRCQSQSKEGPENRDKTFKQVFRYFETNKMPKVCSICKKPPVKGTRGIFQMPSKPELRKLWLQSLKLPENSTVYYVVCSDHFRTQDIWKWHPRPLLARDAIPRPEGYSKKQEQSENDENSCPRKTFVQCPSSSTITSQQQVPNETPSTSTILRRALEMAEYDENSCQGKTVEQSPSTSAITPEQQVPNATPSTSTILRRALEIPESASPASSGMRGIQQKGYPPKIAEQILTYKRTLRNLKMKYKRLVEKTKKAKSKTSSSKINDILNGASEVLPEGSQVVLTSHLKGANVSKYGRRFSNTLKDLALCIYYHSPKGYTYMRKLLNLPTVSTLRTYQNAVPINPGINLQILESIKERCANLDVQNRIVSLAFDEIYLTDKEKSVGDADDGRAGEPVLAKCVLVLEVKWMVKNVKQVIGYYLPSEDATFMIFDIVTEAIDKLHESNVIVKALVCDQGPLSQQLFEQLELSVENPYFVRNDVTIHFIYDCPHLLTSLRNDVAQYTLQYKGKTVDWAEIEKVYKLSLTKKLNLIPKINKKHFELTAASKMRVSLAAEIFSESVYTAMLVYKELFREQCSPVTDATCEFVHDIDKLFDSVNSCLTKRSETNKLRCAVTRNSPHVKFLNDMLQNFQTIQFNSFNNPDCVNGWIISIQSILNLFDDVDQNYALPYLQTKRLNRDSSESLLAVIKQQHGCVYPSVQQFESSLRYTIGSQLSKLCTITNCELDYNYVLTKAKEINHIR